MKDIILNRFKNAIDTNNSDAQASSIQEIRSYANSVWDKAIIFAAVQYCVQQKNHAGFLAVMALWKSCPHPTGDGEAKLTVMTDVIKQKSDATVVLLITEWQASSLQDPWQFHAASIAIQENDVNVLENMLLHWQLNLDQLLEVAIKQGDSALLCTQALIKRNKNSAKLTDLDIFLLVAKNGHLHTLELLSTVNAIKSKQQFISTPEKFELHPPYQTYNALYLAAINGHLGVVKYLLQHQSPVQDFCIINYTYIVGGKDRHRFYNYYPSSSSCPIKIAKQKGHHQIAMLLAATLWIRNNILKRIFSRHTPYYTKDDFDMNSLIEAVQLYFCHRNRLEDVFQFLVNIQSMKENREIIEIALAQAFVDLDPKALVLLKRHSAQLPEHFQQSSKILYEMGLSLTVNQQLANAKIDWMAMQLNEKYLQLNLKATLKIKSTLKNDLLKCYFITFIQQSLQREIEQYAALNKVNLSTLTPLSLWDRMTGLSEAPQSSEQIQFALYYLESLLATIPSSSIPKPDAFKQTESASSSSSTSSSHPASMSITKTSSIPVVTEASNSNPASSSNSETANSISAVTGSLNSSLVPNSLSQAELVAKLGAMPIPPDTNPIEECTLETEKVAELS